MIEFVRESATNEADLPHRWQLAQGPGLVPVCQVCQAQPSDARHIAWQQQELADREQAHAELVRETGS